MADFDAAAAREQFIAYRAKHVHDAVTWEAWHAAYAAGVAAERARLLADMCPDCRRMLRDGPR